MATYPDRTRHLIAAGGDARADTATWIYELDSGIALWRPGPEFPFEAGASVQFGDTFLAVGGESNDGSYTDSNQIWEFNANPLDEKWILRPERLKTSKHNLAAFLVPNYYATC